MTMTISRVQYFDNLTDKITLLRGENRDLIDKIELFRKNPMAPVVYGEDYLSPLQRHKKCVFCGNELREEEAVCPGCGSRRFER